MNFELVPSELQSLPQWVCWNGNKVPLNPVTGKPASVSDPTTWSSFAVAVAAAEKYSGIGFVLTGNDPYAVMDFDNVHGDKELEDEQVKIFQWMDSYSEISPSGKGLHVWVRADVEQARKLKHVELYGEARYMTVTGNVYHDAPIEDRQSQVTALCEYLGKPKALAPLINGEQRESDQELLTRAYMASNGETIRDLYEGRWEDKYSSQSEADLALMNHIVFYTQNEEQATRIFLASALGQRDKAKRPDYLRRLLQRASDQVVPPVDPSQLVVTPQVDVDDLRETPVVEVRSSPLLVPPPSVEGDDIDIPGGLMGEIASFIYENSPRPCRTIAIAGAIGLMSGICGRAYNVSNTGLNMYTLLLAKTGRGKEAMASGIARIIQQVKEYAPSADKFIGPAAASGQALARYFNVNRSFVSIMGEFGLELKRLSSAKASSSDIALRRMLLEAYSKSGHGMVFRGSVFADITKNTDDVIAPAFSILGESTPENYYGGVDEHAIAEGLMPRFLTIEYNGPRPPRSKQSGQVVLPDDVAHRLGMLCLNATGANNENEVIHVQMAPEAETFLDHYDAELDHRMNTSQRDVLDQLWNRAHLKTLKLAAQVACGVHPYTPEIQLNEAQWAKYVVERDINSVVARFDNGETGHVGDSSIDFGKQRDSVLRILAGYRHRDLSSASMSGVTKAMQERNIIPKSVISRGTLNHTAFRRDRRGANSALKDVVSALVADGILVKVPPAQMWEHYQSRAEAYYIDGELH